VSKESAALRLTSLFADLARIHIDILTTAYEVGLRDGRTQKMRRKFLVGEHGPERILKSPRTKKQTHRRKENGRRS
jgi:hypothetical protein